MAGSEDAEVGPRPAPKADPADFALRARPRAVTRLSRRALVVAARGVAVCVAGAVWWAFALHSFRITAGKELYNTNVRPSAEAMSRLPNGYASLTKPKPAPAPPMVQPVPRQVWSRWASRLPVLRAVTAHSPGCTATRTSRTPSRHS